MKKCLAELLGTFGLVFAGTGAIVIDQVSGGSVTHVGVDDCDGDDLYFRGHFRRAL